MKHSMIRFLGMLTAVLTVGGCVFFNAPDPAYYDLFPTPLDGTGEFRVAVGAFRNDSGAGTPFRTRRAGRIVEDGGHKWVLPPAELTERALRLALPSRPRAAGVRGELLVFEYDADAGQFRFAADYRVDNRGARRFETAISADGTPDGIARAASAAVGKFAEKLNRELP